MNLGIAIKTLRKELGISQHDLALKSGISQASLSQFENGLKTPSAKTIDKIGQSLNIPSGLLYLLGVEQGDVPESRKFIYNSLFPSIKDLALRIMTSEEEEIS